METVEERKRLIEEICADLARRGELLASLLRELSRATVRLTAHVSSFSRSMVGRREAMIDALLNTTTPASYISGYRVRITDLSSHRCWRMGDTSYLAAALEPC